jgi:hypothetical protein
MRERYKSIAVAVCMPLCVVATAATQAQDKLERFQERPEITVEHSLEAVSAALKTAATVDGGVGDIARRNIAGRADIEVQVLAFLPLGSADTGLADLGGQSDRTEIVVTLAELPPDLLNPSLTAQIHEGTCLDLKSGLVHASGETETAYSLTPSVSSLRSFAAVIPASLTALRSSAHAITVRNSPELGIADTTCVDVL